MVKLPMLLMFVAIQLALSSPIADDLIIKLPDGQVRGTTYVTRTNKTYFGFQGIPFASPPIGSLRFEPPQPPKQWTGVWDATRDRNVCLTTSPQASANEDCLYVNVYTPEIKPTTKLPVMFWIYGGAFVSGNSLKAQYGPDFMVEKDVIMVSFNYRLGPFGFLSTGDTVIPGNAGLKDQLLALKWTNDNIEYFGGDREKITIYGQSAGGASTGLHLLSTKSAGLFRAAIVESGSALNPFTIQQDPKSYVVSLVTALNGENYENDTQKLKQYLLEKSAEEIISASASFELEPAPVMEVENENAFITSSPYELLASGRFNKVPIMIGICAEESLMFLGGLEGTKKIAADIDSNPIMYIPTDFKPNDTDVIAVIKGIHDMYLNDGELLSNNLPVVAEMYTDNGFARGIMKHAELAAGFVNVYLYQFAYYGRPIVKPFIDGAEKAGHSAELPFIFKYWNLSDTTDPADMLTQNRMTTLWTNFVKFLNPTPDPSELLSNIIWPTIDSLNLSDVPYLNINNTVELKSNLKGKAYTEWVNLYEKYAQKPFITY